MLYENEFILIMDTLKRCVSRPSMYAYHPECLEILCKHLVHICFVHIDNKWSWELTEEYWQTKAQLQSNNNQFALKKFESEEYRDLKWGNCEEDVRSDLIKVFQNIWNLLPVSCKSNTPLSNWIKFLFLNSESLGSPDTLGMVLLMLMQIASDKCLDRFNSFYKAECIRLKGNYHRGFLDYRTQSHWQPVIYKFDKDEYDKVTSGVQSMIEEVEAQKSVIDS